jgi:hypothetical protein
MISRGNQGKEGKRGMTREIAVEIIKELQGWDDPQIIENKWGDVYIIAIEPISRKLMVYDEDTGFFS